MNILGHLVGKTDKVYFDAFGYYGNCFEQDFQAVVKEFVIAADNSQLERSFQTRQHWQDSQNSITAFGAAADEENKDFGVKTKAFKEILPVLFLVKLPADKPAGNGNVFFREAHFTA